MRYIYRKVTPAIHAALQRGKSILLLGPRQTGKTTLIQHAIKPDIFYTFADPEIRIRYEKDPALLSKELKAQSAKWEKPPVIFIDEVQKIPAIMDTAQLLIDQKKAQFILTGSSAHKLKHGPTVNLLPGRVLVFTMDPLHLDELPKTKHNLDDILTCGTLPLILQDSTLEEKEQDLRAYVTTYLEEEIRAEALVRNVGNFSRFLELAASESGQIINFTKLSQEIGVATSTIIDYFQILEDCMIIARIDPITKSFSHRRLIKSPKYLFFDLGIRRTCANESIHLPNSLKPKLFEQWIGIELLHQTQDLLHTKIKYWRDASGIEVDYVIEHEKSFIPIEVKWTEKPSISDAKHLQKFLSEYPNTSKGYIICRTPRAFEIIENIIALPWQEITTLFHGRSSISAR